MACTTSLCRGVIHSVASSSRRTLCSSAVVTAAAKGKAASKAPVKKKQQSGNFSKGKANPKRGGGGKGDSALASIRSDLIRDAPDLSGIPRLHPDFITPNNVGRPAVVADATYRVLQTFGLPARLAREVPKAGAPTFVVRQSTVDLVDRLDQAAKASSSSSRLVLTGDRGNGKSTLLYQAVNYCLEQNWIVCYVPKAQDWINSSSPYEYDAAAKRFNQPALASAILAQLATANAQALKALNLTAKVERGAKDAGSSVALLEEVFDKLASQSEYPVLLAIDDFQALFQRSEYRSTDNSPLESFHLSTPSLALEYVTGRKAFNKGAVLGALSTSNPTLKPSQSLLTSLKLATPAPVTPYDAVEPTHEANAQGLESIRVPRALSAQEAAGMYQVWATRGLVPHPSDEGFMAGYVASGGNAGELARGWKASLLG